MAKKERINLIEIDAETGTFKIYGMQQPHSPVRLQAEVTQLQFGDKVRKRVIRHAIVRIVVFVEKEDKVEQVARVEEVVPVEKVGESARP